MKKLLQLMIIGLGFVVTGFALMATASRSYAQPVDHPSGVSLRDESVRRGSGARAGFFYAYGRSHGGGGIRGGK